MRVVCCCHDPFPSPAAHTQQIFWTLVEVARLGVEVRLLVPGVGEAGGAGGAGRDELDALGQWYGVPAGTMPRSLSVEILDGIRSPRWLSQASFDYHIPAAVNRYSPDLVWTRNVAAAVWLTRAGLPTIFETYRPDIAEDWRFAPWRWTVLGGPALRGLIHHSAVADAAFARAGVPRGRRLVARNGFAPEWMTPRLDRETARQVVGLPLERPLVVYAGDLHRAKGIGALIHLAAATPEAQVLAIGADTERTLESAEALAREAGASNVLVRRRVPIGDLAPFLYAADCLVIPPPEEPIERSRTVLPIKVFLYLAAGRAILAPDRPDLREVLTDGVTARFFEPRDTASAARVLRELLQDAALREELGQKGLAESAKHTWANRARTIARFLEERS